MWKREWRPLVLMTGVFAAFYFLPVGRERVDNAVLESLHLTRDYAREHVLLCLIPAFFLAGAIAVFLNRGAVMKYLGADANKFVAYTVAATAGTILAVCSCTVLPLFAGIHRRGAGLGPATAFLYSGPAINVLAIILTARVLGIELGIARAVGAILFSVVIGLCMHAIFHDGDRPAPPPSLAVASEEDDGASLGLISSLLVPLLGILIFANWAPAASGTGAWNAIHELKWIVTGGFAIWLLGSVTWLAGRRPGAFAAWVRESWTLAKQILPLLLIGVLAAGLLLGRPNGEGLIPAGWVSRVVGGNGLLATLFASVAGALMYFATLTEVPILEGLLGNGMGNGPALALLLAGPALSLPNMLVIRSVMGTRKTLTYVGLVVVMATITGFLYGSLFP